MNKALLTCVLLVLSVTCSHLFANTINENVTITWPFNIGGPNQIAQYSGQSVSLFNQDYVDKGSNLVFHDTRTTYGIVFTRFQPLVQNNNPTENDFVSFNIRPKTGLLFQPTSISFLCHRYGTDGGRINIVWRNAGGVSTTLQTALVPARDNSGAATSVNLNITNIPASAGEGSLLIYLYSLGNTRQIGLSNVQISGTVTGSIANVTSFPVVVSAFPVGAGNITSNPIGNQFDQGTSVTLTANRHFGFVFSHWADTNQVVVATNNPYTFTLQKATNLRAVFTPINTYALSLQLIGGAKPYMIAINPAPTVVNGQNRYEEGAVVTLQANNNPIFTFNHWQSAETNPQTTVTMNQNHQLTATYSAVDYIVGWDFHQLGNNGRTADFFVNDNNQVATLVLRNAAGITQGWLDKSQVASFGYEGKPAAVNWRPITDRFYYQLSFNATGFTNIVVSSSMLYNFNAHATQRIEYSLDGVHFTLLDEVVMTAPKVWFPKSVQLPVDANHASRVFIRWIPNYSSALVGTSSNNDGTSIAEIFVFARSETQNDGVAPVWVSSVPQQAGVGASTTGRVVLNFDERVQVTTGAMAKVGNINVVPTVSGQTISFAYAGLHYNTSYLFTLPANTVSDLSGNLISTPITIQFTTLNRPVVTKKPFDFIVGRDGDFKAAMQAAQSAAATGNRFYIFFPNGHYNIGENTGDANQMTTIPVPKLSIVGQNADSVVIFNKSIQESINTTATLYFTSTSNNNYLQDLSLMNKMDFRTGTFVGRGVALWDQGNKNIYKRVSLLSNQDTYYSGNNIRSYFEESAIHGTVDFICGGGDVYFNQCLLFLENRANNVIVAPSTSTQWGYVFNQCTIDGFPVNNNGYRLGRSWSNAPKAVFLNTTMRVLPTAAAWGDPMNVVPSVFAEFNSITTTGTAVDLSNRRTTFTKDANTVVLNPVLSKQQADEYSIENVLGGSDGWQPQYHTDQAPVPTIRGNDRVITWDNNDYVLCWAVFKNNVFQQFVTDPIYTIPSEVAVGSVYTLRAANEMGGLSAESNSYVLSDVLSVLDRYEASALVSQQYYTPQGKRITHLHSYKGVVIVRTTYANGFVRNEKMLKITP